jgi:hypothetical protein
MPGSIFTGTLTLPSGWLSNTVISAQFVGTSSGAVINAGALSNDNTTWGSWITATSDVTITTTWAVSGEGANKPIYLHLRDVNDQVATVVTGTVNVDTTAPTGSVVINGGASSIARRASATVTLALSATDDVSGVGGMMLSNRADFAGASWQTYATSATWTLDNNSTVYVRFKDNAGNVSQTYSARGQSSVYLPLIVR